MHTDATIKNYTKPLVFMAFFVTFLINYTIKGAIDIQNHGDLNPLTFIAIGVNAYFIFLNAVRIALQLKQDL